MQQHAVPKINPLFRLQFEKAQDCYVLLFPEGMVKLNESAGEILALIDGQADIAHVINELEKKFPQAGSLSNDILDFLVTAAEKKWVYYD